MDLGGEFVGFSGDGEGLQPVVNVLGGSFGFFPRIPESREGKGLAVCHVEAVRSLARGFSFVRSFVPWPENGGLFFSLDLGAVTVGGNGGDCPLIEAVRRDDAAATLNGSRYVPEVAMVSARALMVLMPLTSARDLLKKGMRPQRIRTNSRSLVSRASLMTGCMVVGATL
jgi:hypothetical protein